MSSVLATIYGVHLVFLFYLSAYFTVRGLFGAEKFPIYIILAKYFIYWKIIDFGFTNLPVNFILIGLISATYLSLPILYSINQKYFSK